MANPKNNAVTIVPLSIPELQAMLDKAIEKATLAAAKATGEQWGVKELAAHYKVSERTIHNWERTGRLPMRYGKHWLRADILQWDKDRMPK